MKIFNKLLGIVLVFVSTGLCSISAASDVESSTKIELSALKSDKRNVVVISDRVYQANQQYFVYPEVSEMIAQEVINELNREGFVYAPTLSSVRERLKKADLVVHADKLLRDFHYTYNIDFNALNKIAKKLGADDILLITGGLDTVSDFLKPTWYNFLNIPGENVVKSEYRMYTHFALIDVQNEIVTWQNSYTRHITSPEFALANATFSPDYRQMTKIKKGSYIIAKDAAYRVESAVTPELAAAKEPPTMRERMKYKIDKKYDEHIQNVNLKREQKAQNEAKARLDAQKAAQNEAFLKSVETKNVKSTKTNTSKEFSAVDLTPYTSGAQSSDDKDVKVSPINIIIPKM